MADRRGGVRWRQRACCAAGLLVVALACGSASGLINQNYTPVDVVHQSEKVLKAATPAPAMVFLGDFAEAKDEQADEDTGPIGAVYLGAEWFGLTKRPGGVLQLRKDIYDLKTVWAGGNGMLARLVRYVLADSRADVPTNTSTAWAAEVRMPAVQGRIGGVIPVDTGRESPAAALILARSGDRLLRRAGGVSLQTRSDFAACGDFNADGRLDVLLGGPNGCTMLANRDGRTFREVIRETGELIYISKPKVVAASNCDVNNDGRQDVVLFYAGMGFQVFFNRGFRCFGFANLLDLKHSRLAAAGALAHGQLAGTVLDFNGDGAPDVVAVTPAGQVCALLRDAKRGGNLGVTVSLPPGRAGPVTVVGYDGKRCLGARSVAAGRAAFFGKRAKGPITLKWTLGAPGPQSKRVIVLRPTRWCVPK